jgi:anti-sigma factor RsiW
VSTRPSMSCRELVALVTEYLDGTMAHTERIRFERHVAVCPPCRAHLEQMRETIRASGALTEESISPEARDALLDAFADWTGG